MCWESCARSSTPKIFYKYNECMARFSNLHPLTIEQRHAIARAALDCFYPLNFSKVCKIIGKEHEENIAHPLTGQDFLKYLSTLGILPSTDDTKNPAQKYQQSIRYLLNDLVIENLLQRYEFPSRDPMMGTGYFFLMELTSLQKKNDLWLAPALGPEYLKYRLHTSVVHIIGDDKDGQERAGTGIIIAPNWILTCAHVIEDMKVRRNQIFQGLGCEVVECIYQHKRSIWHKANAFIEAERIKAADVGFIRVDKMLSVIPGLAFRNPRLLETVYTLGYPLIPESINATLVMQSGEVSNEAMTDRYGHDIFLYSAISRPGNSGGPIFSREGHILGIVTQEKSMKYSKEDGSLENVSPFFAGVPTDQILSVVKDIIPYYSLNIPVEDYS